MKRLLLAALLAAFAGGVFAQGNYNESATAWTPYDRDSSAASPGGD